TSELSKRMDKSPSQKAKDSSTLRIRLIGANVSPLIEGKDEVSTKTNYLIGNDPSRWHTNVPNFAKVEYRDVYPGVNLIYYGDQRQLEYDFVVSPKADPSLIKMQFMGARSVRIGAKGDLILQTVGSEIRQEKAIVYQGVDGVRRTIEGRYL